MRLNNVTKSSFAKHKNALHPIMCHFLSERLTPLFGGAIRHAIGMRLGRDRDAVLGHDQDAISGHDFET